MVGGSSRFVALVVVAAIGVFVVAGLAFRAFATNTNDGDSAAQEGDDAAMQEATATATATATPSPTPTPTPTPTPEPVLEHCYEPRAEATPAAGETTPTPGEATPGDGEGTPEASPGDEEVSGFRLRPARERSMFQQCQVVAFYGRPGIPGLGTLGEGSVEEMIARLEQEAAAYDASNGSRDVVPAFHIITALAHPTAGDDGTYLGRMDYEELEEWISIAEERDFIILLDLQMGHSTVDDEVAHYIEHLKHPRVHLALDPEWAMRESGQAPGQSIGNMDASEINRAQEMVQELVDEHNLHNKIVVVHQFQVQMIRNKEMLETFPGVDLVIHMDGYGGRESKIGGYRRYVEEDGADHGGFKLFYEWDVDFMPPEVVNELVPQPDVVTFQ